MQVVSVHEDALVVTSRLWQTNAVALRSGSEALLVDSPYFPDELEALPALLAQAGFEPDGLVATHADFDHLLGRAAFPGLALGVAESSALRLQGSPGEPQRVLRDYDARFYVSRARPLSLGSLQPLPVPGRLELGEVELELHEAVGHTADGMALFHGGLLICGDYLSPVEIPMLSPGGSLEEYRLTLARLAPVVERSDVVVPGHGRVLSSVDALRVLDEDAAYLDELENGGGEGLPDGRDSSEQRRIHAANVEFLS